MNGRGPIFGTRLNGFHLLDTTPALDLLADEMETDHG